MCAMYVHVVQKKNLSLYVSPHIRTYGERCGQRANAAQCELVGPGERNVGVYCVLLAAFVRA